MALLIIGGVLSIITGILILAFPKFLRFVIGIYLVIAGILAVIP